MHSAVSPNCIRQSAGQIKHCEFSIHVWKTDRANLDDKLGVFVPTGGTMAYWENHANERGRLQQFFAPNYRTNVGKKAADEIISETAVAFAPNAPHTKILPVTTAKSGENIFTVAIGKWRLTINLGDRPGVVPGQREKLPALSARVDAGSAAP